MEIEQGGLSDEVLARLAPQGRDRGLCWFLVLGTLRRRGDVDTALRPVLSRPLGGLDAPVRAVLRLGAFEKLYGRAPGRAAVHQAVEVVKGLRLGRAGGFVNAVLRKVREPEPGLNHPAWLVERWRARYGVEATSRWCAENNEPAPLGIVLADPSDDLGEAVPDAPPGCRRWDEGDPGEIPGFSEGRFWVQDPAAVKVADLLPVAEGDRVLDACSAPGGKTLRLCQRGASVVAVDRDESRLARVRENADRLGYSVQIRSHDWTGGPMPQIGELDGVLVDAPCTALGLIRRHPEIRWRRQEPDIAEAAVRQLAILAAASTHVRAGGSLVYAVCSPEPEEGEQVVARFVEEHPAFSVERTLCTAPPVHGEDAHYAALMRRSS